MDTPVNWFAMAALVLALTASSASSSSPTAAESPAPEAKPNPQEVIELLKAGNERFCSEHATHPHTAHERVELAGKSNQARYAVATVLSCSDSRVPVELVFDAGVMDLFVIRVAGNVCDTDEIGSIEYGMLHVETPVLVVLGHTQCGAVKAVAEELHGHGHPLERNIPALVDNIFPAVSRVIHDHPHLHDEKLLDRASEENVWQSISDLFLKSPAVRKQVSEGKAAVVGAIYEVGSGRVSWLPQENVLMLLQQAEESPLREMDPLASH